MDYPVIDPAGTGANIRDLIRNNGKTVTETAGFLGLAEKSTMYKWIRGDALPGIDNLLVSSWESRSTIYWRPGRPPQIQARGAKRTAQRSPKPRIPDHTRTGLLIAPWCNRQHAGL